MPLEDDPETDPPAVTDVALGDGEIIVYDTDVQAAWVQGEAVDVPQ